MNAGGRVLVVEDNDTERRALVQLLRAAGLTVYGAESPDKALGYVDENIDVVLSDLQMGQVSGLDLLGLWKKRKPETHFILLTGHSSVSTAVEAIKAGAYDYITKPVIPEELTLLMRRAIDSNRKDQEIENLHRRLDRKFGLSSIVGQSQPMQDVFARIQRAAPVDSTVLILGESGTGKELVAQALHHNSPRKKGPFVLVNIAAVPAALIESELFGHVRGAFTGATDRRIGRFEQADGGTLFIDEVGDFELPLQAKLLRVLESLTVAPVGGSEDRRVDVRVLAATSRDIHKMVAQETFRKDLFYRLNVVTINLPPLRQRSEDIPMLIDHFMKELSESRRTAPKKMAPEVVRQLVSYAWPGNVRELRNALESMMVLCDGDTITEADLPERIRQGSSASTSWHAAADGLRIEDLECLAINRALDQCKGNRTRAAEKLGISVRTLQRKLRQYKKMETSSQLRKIGGDILT